MRGRYHAFAASLVRLSNASLANHGESSRQDPQHGSIAIRKTVVGSMHQSLVLQHHNEGINDGSHLQALDHGKSGLHTAVLSDDV